MQSLARAGGSGTSDLESNVAPGDPRSPARRATRRFSTVTFLRSSPILLKNHAKLRYTFGRSPNESPYEKHALQDCAKRFVSIRSQMLYPVELRALKSNFRSFTYEKAVPMQHKRVLSCRKSSAPAGWALGLAQIQRRRTCCQAALRCSHINATTPLPKNAAVEPLSGTHFCWRLGFEPH